MNFSNRKSNKSSVGLFLSIFLCIALSSCSKWLIRRNTQGDKTTYNPRKSEYTHVKKKVALLPLFNESPFGGNDLGVVATEEFRNELVRTGQFLIAQNGVQLFGSSKEVYSGGGSKLVQLAKKAKMSGVNFVLYGRIIDARIREKSDEIGIVRKTKSYTEALIELRIFDINSSKEIFSKKLYGNADDSTFRFYASGRENRLIYRQELLRYSVKVAVRRFIPTILDFSAKLDWVGRVARIIGTKVYVNAGRKAGINIGDILRVLTEGEEIYDPETGALIGMSKGEVKGTLEVIDYFGPDGAIAVLHSGGSVVEGDFIQLY